MRRSIEEEASCVQRSAEASARAESLGTDADVTATMGTELQRVGAGGGNVAVKTQIPFLFPTP